MAELKDFGVPGTGIGILHPTMMHRFRFRVGEGDTYNLVTAQVTRLEFNMVKQEMKVWVQQPMTVCQDLLDLVESLAKWNHTAYVEMLDGDAGVLGLLKCVVKMTDHRLELDYAKSDVATHELTFSYTKAH